MNLFLIGIIIFVIVYLLLNAFARASSKKIALILKKIAVYLSLILAALFTIGGKFLFSLPFLFIILSGLKIKSLTALQWYQDVNVQNRREAMNPKRQLRWSHL